MGFEIPRIQPDPPTLGSCAADACCNELNAQIIAGTLLGFNITIRNCLKGVPLENVYCPEWDCDVEVGTTDYDGNYFVETPIPGVPCGWRGKNWATEVVGVLYLCKDAGGGVFYASAGLHLPSTPNFCDCFIDTFSCAPHCCCYKDWSLPPYNKCPSLFPPLHICWNPVYA